MKKRITLVWPPSSTKPNIIYPNLSIAYLSKFLKMNGFDVTNIDLNIYFYQLKKKDTLADGKNNLQNVLKSTMEIIEKTKPDILCMSNWHENLPFSIEFIKYFKSRNDHCVIIMGGYPSSFTPNKILALVPAVDFIVRGEGDFTILELCRELCKTRRNFQKIDGISYIDKNKKVVHTNNRLPISNLDDLPIIDFEDFIGFNPNNFNLLNIITARGCPYSKCIFCSILGMFGCYRVQSKGYVLSQVKHLIKLYNPDEICINDDDFLTDVKRLNQLTTLFSNDNLQVKFSCGGRGDKLNRKTLNTLQRAGFVHISLGVETIVPKILEYYNKAFDIKNYLRDIKKGIYISKEFHIRIAASFIFGSPIETMDDMMANVKFIHSIADRICRFDISQLVIYPGSYLWQDYTNGKIELFKMNKKETYLESLYSHLPWIVPHAYMVRNKYIPDKEFSKMIEEIKLLINSVSVNH